MQLIRYLKNIFYEYIDLFFYKWCVNEMQSLLKILLEISKN